MSAVPSSNQTVGVPPHERNRQLRSGAPSSVEKDSMKPALGGGDRVLVDLSQEIPSAARDLRVRQPPWGCGQGLRARRDERFAARADRF